VNGVNGVDGVEIFGVGGTADVDFCTPTSAVPFVGTVVGNFGGFSVVLCLLMGCVPNTLSASSNSSLVHVSFLGVWSIPRSLTNSWRVTNWPPITE